GLRLAAREGTAPQRGVLTLTKPAETFVFAGLTERPVPSLNRGFSAPIKLTIERSADDLRFLAARDTDPFNRWQALQTLATGVLIDNVGKRPDGGAQRNKGLIEALASVLADHALEPAFAALALTLPSEADIARDIGKDVDPGAIFRERTSLRGLIGAQLAEALRLTHRRMTSSQPYSPDAASAGRRALRNSCLDLLVATGDKTARALAVEQFTAADNMTDRLAALATLSLQDVPERDT